MSTVYTHIKPFTKRAINVFKQDLYRIGERGKISSALDELYRKQDFFREFVGTRLSSVQRAYIEGLARGVELDIADCLDEKMMLESLLSGLNPCAACGGCGEFIEHLDQDDTRRVVCPACRGSGSCGE